MFSGARNPTVLLEILSDVTGSQKSTMAASNLEIRISRLVDMIATKFQRLSRLAIDAILNHVQMDMPIYGVSHSVHQHFSVMCTA